MFKLQYHKDLYFLNYFLSAIFFSSADFFIPDVLKKQKLHGTFWVASSSMYKTPRDYTKFKDSVSLKPYITTQFYKPSIYSKSFFFRKINDRIFRSSKLEGINHLFQSSNSEQVWHFGNFILSHSQRPNTYLKHFGVFLCSVSFKSYRTCSILQWPHIRTLNENIF